MVNNETKKKMKKILLVMMAVLATAASFAQFSRAIQSRELTATKGVNDLPTWHHIAAPFVATDINGNTVSLQSYLDAGKYVIIDYSCTWCGPCWSMHQSGLLEDIDAEDNFQVMWVEIETGNTTQAIYGNSAGGSTQGNWTVDRYGNPITYPIIDDASCLNTCVSLYEGYVPSIYMITPDGYFCSVYGASYGFGTSTSAAQAIANLNALATSAPAPNQIPTVAIAGANAAVVGSPANFTANIVSVDSIISIEWAFQDGTPATATGETASTVWSTTGNKTVTLTVTNTTGSATATLNVNVIEWNWGDVMTYATDTYASSIGAGGSVTWAAKYPAALMTGRNYLSNVELFCAYDGHVTMDIYETNPGADPTMNDLLYEGSYAISATQSYVALPIYDRIALSAGAKDLWVVFSCNDISYPASACEFTGDPNGSLIYFQGAWSPIYELDDELVYTWMIKTTTSATAPAMVVSINGNSNVIAGQNVTLTANGPAAATYTWNIPGATPETINGTIANFTFANAGNYTATLTATLDGETATATFGMTAISCETINIPFTTSFEDGDNFGCWNFVDADGDGNHWMLFPNATVAHTGSSCIASASYDNASGPLHPNNWLITPKVAIPANGASLDFWVKGIDANYAAEHYGVFVSTTGNEPANFTNSLLETNSTGVWEKKHLNLTPYAGQEIYIAFRHFNISDMFYLAIDDLAINGGFQGIEDVREANVAIYPNPTTSILNINAEGVQEVSVLDMNGRTIMSEQNANTIDMSELANGVYFVRVITNNGVSTQKIVKK